MNEQDLIRMLISVNDVNLTERQLSEKALHTPFQLNSAQMTRWVGNKSERGDPELTTQCSYQ